MSIHKATNSYSNWNPNLEAEDLEDYIDPVDKEEITKNIQTIFDIVSLAKKTRKDSYNFDPNKLHKEKQIKKAKKELQRLKSQSSALARENNNYKKELKLLEKTRKDEMPYVPISKIFKKPTAQQREHMNNFLQNIEHFEDTLSAIQDIREFNSKAEDEIKKLTKEIDSDRFNYEI